MIEDNKKMILEVDKKTIDEVEKSVSKLIDHIFDVKEKQAEDRHSIETLSRNMKIIIERMNEMIRTLNAVCEIEKIRKRGHPIDIKQLEFES